MKLAGWAALGLVGLSCLACRKDEPHPERGVEQAAASTSSPAQPAASAAPPRAPDTDLALPKLAETRGCRAILVKGAVATESGGAVTEGTALERPEWLVLEKGAELVVKHAMTARELRLKGPARAVPCVRGTEEFWVASGIVTTVTQVGARPGGEVWIGSPWGLVRYGDAALEIRVNEKGLAVKSNTGDAWVETVLPKAAEEHVTAGGAAHEAAVAVDVKALVGACENAAGVAEERARAVLAPAPSGAPLGARAADHVRARRAARAACAVASAALGTMKMGRDRDEFDRALAQAGDRIRSVPGL